MARDRAIEFLQRLAITAAETLDAVSLVDLVVAETTGALGVDVCSVYLLEHDGVGLLLSATNGLSRAGVGTVRLRVGQGITGWAAAERTAVVVPDVREDRRFCWLAGVDQARFVSMASVPIVSADRLVGVLNVQTDAVRHFTIDDIELLSSIAAQVAGVLERSALHAKLEAQVAELHRSQEIHRRFTELSLDGAGLEAICDEMAAQSGCGVALFDDDGVRRLVAGAADELPERLRRPVTVVREATGGEPACRRILAGSAALGWLMVTAPPAHDPRLAVEARMAIEHGTTVLSLELARERAAAEAEERLRGSVIEEILDPDRDPDELARLGDRASRLGYRLRNRMWIVVLSPDDADGRRALRDPATTRRLRLAAQRVAEVRQPGSIVVAQREDIVALIAEPAAADHVERCARHMAGAISEALGVPVSCGVSGGSGTVPELATLTEQARLACRVGRRIGRRGEVSSYRRLGTERLLMAVAPDDELARFVDEWLGALLRQEAQGRGSAPLIDTLEALTGASWSLRAAARRLNIHVNTLLYRIQRIREVARRDLDDPDVRLAFAVALRARTMRDDVAAPAAEHEEADHTRELEAQTPGR